MKKLFPPILTMAVLLFAGCQKSELTPPDEALTSRANCTKNITIPAGSVDVLQAAIDALCDNGVITLAAGEHVENGGVVINKRLTIKGEPGAVLKMQSEVYENTPDILDIAIYVTGAEQVRLEGFELLPLEPEMGGTAIVLHNAHKATIKNCVIRQHYLSIVSEKSNKVEMTGNVVVGSDFFKNFFGHGIVVTTGEDVKIKDNEISNTFFGAWLCDKNGFYQGNNTHHNVYLGMILCKVPEPGYGLPDGSFAFAPLSATNWQVNNNVSTENGAYGYLIIDGANNNHMNNNASWGNGAFDIDVKGGSCEFGFYTPPSFDNFISVGNHDLLIRDCAINTTIVGGTVVNEPCEEEWPCQ